MDLYIFAESIEMRFIMVFIISKSGLAMAKSLIRAAKNVDSFIIGDKMSVFRFKYVLKNYSDYGAFRGAELHICVRGLSMDGGLAFQFHQFEVHMMVRSNN
ncbi:hypothetical protein YC2023_016469 [Brassica napus]